MTRWILAVLLLGSGCRAQPSSKPVETTAWQKIGSWSGHTDAQTESFPSDSGSFRLRWKAIERKPGTGTFRLAIHSSISGRPLAVAVDHRGSGDGTAFVHEDPRVFFAAVEAANEDWSFTIEEEVSGTVTSK